MSNKKWRIRKKINKDLIKKFPEINPIILQLLFNRGMIEQKDIEEFLLPGYEFLENPFLFKDIKKAIKLVKETINRKEKIAIYGDYDADGVTSSAVLASFFKDIKVDFEIYIPDREKEGYGLNEKAIKYLAKKGVKLIITVDCGISGAKEVEMAKKMGIKTIITDHHEASGPLPKCPIINPKVDDNYPFRDLAGVGVAFKFVQALLRSGSKDINERKIEAFEKWLLDLVAVGTIADCMPLVSENRILVKYGLIVLNKTRRRGLKILMEKIGLNLGEINSRDISYRVAPRINAAGRMRHANLAYDLLMSNSTKKSIERSERLIEANLERQKITEKITKRILTEIGEKASQKVIFSFQKDCPVGILGLIAGRVSDIYNRPCFVLTEKDGEIIGSGRSIEGFDVMEGLQSMDDLFSHYGGHKGACGLSLKKREFLEKFKERFLNFANQKLKESDLVSVLKVDAEIYLNDIDWGLFDELQKFSPFGEKNSKPIFLTRNLKVFSSREVGQKGKHLKIFVNELLPDSSCSKDCIGFGLGEEWKDKLKSGDKIDLIYEIDENRWNGNREIQLKVIDLRKI